MKTASTTKPGSQKFCFSHDGIDFGPCTSGELREQVRLGQLTPDDLVWKAGAQQKRPARLVPWLFLSHTTNESKRAVTSQPIPDSPTHFEAPHPTKRKTAERGSVSVSAANSSPKAEGELPQYKAVLNSAHEVCATTIQYGRQFAVAVVSLLQGNTTVSEIVQIWPSGREESKRLTIGCCTGVLSLILLSRLWPSPYSSSQQFSPFFPAMSGYSAAATSDAVTEYKMRVAEAREEQEERSKEIEMEVDRLLLKAAELRNAEKFHASENTYSKAIELAPQNVDAHVGLAETLFKLNDPSKAVSSLWQAVEKSRADKQQQLDLLTRISGHHIQNEEYGQAVRALDRAIAIEPEEGAYYFAAGVASINGKKYEQAIKYLETAVEYFHVAGQTGNWEHKAYVHLATAHQHLNETTEALQLCDKVLVIDPNNLDAHCVRGLIYAQNNAVDPAVAELQFVARDPDCNRSMLESFAEAFRRNRQWESCSLVYSKLMDMEPESAAWCHMRAVMRMRIGQFEAADLDCQRAQAMVKDNDPQSVSLKNLREMIRDLKDNQISYDEFMTQNEARKMQEFLGPAAFFPDSGSFSAPAATSPGSTYDYLTPHQAGKLGAMGLQIVPGHYFQR
jgi:tetratricopeptide (TPR) repeat protein